MVTLGVSWLSAKYNKDVDEKFLGTVVVDFTGLCCTAGILTSKTFLGG